MEERERTGCGCVGDTLQCVKVRERERENEKCDKFVRKEIAREGGEKGPIL